MFIFKQFSLAYVRDFYVKNSWSTTTSSFAQQIVLVTSWALWPGSNLRNIVLELDYVERSSVQFSNHMRIKTIHNVSAHQLPWYY